MTQRYGEITPWLVDVLLNDIPFLQICLVVATLGRVGSKLAAIGRGHELTALGKELHKLGSGHILGTTSIETLVGSELVDYSLNKVIGRRIGIALHHVENFVSVCHGKKSCYVVLREDTFI